MYIGILIWLLKERQGTYICTVHHLELTDSLKQKKKVIYSLQDVSAALAVFWSLVAVVGLYSVSALFGVIGGITVN